MSKLAVHYIPTHDRKTDKDFIQQRSRYCLKLVYSGMPDVGHLRQMLGLVDLPNATIILRNHPLSEQKDDVLRDPVGTGKRHAREWAEALTKLYGETPLKQAKKVGISGINECPYWNAPGPKPWVDYYCALADDTKLAGVMMLELPPGHPDNSGADTPSNWKPFDAAIQRCSIDGHWMELHEYWGLNHGPQFYAGWWAWRYRHLIQYNPRVPIFIGECGPIKEYQRPDGTWGQIAKDGWMGDLQPQTAVAQINEYDDGLMRDPQVTYAVTFTTDGGHPWIEQFDTEGLQPHWTRSATQWPGMPPTPDPTPPPTSAKVFWPAPSGVITGRFAEPYTPANGPAYLHEGLDIGAPLGSRVVAAADGIVAYNGVDAEYGNYVRIFHKERGAHTFYAHMQEPSPLAVGSTVRAGQQIGKVGSTGNSSGPHLHFEVRTCKEDGSYVDTSYGFGKGRCNPEAALWLWGLR